MKSRIWRVGSAVFAAALLAVFSHLYQRLAALLVPAPLGKAPQEPVSPGKQGVSTPAKPAHVTVAVEKKLKTVFIDCNGIYD